MDPRRASDLAGRAHAPVVRYFEALGSREPQRRTDDFLLWLQDRGLSARLDRVPRSPRQFLKGLLALFSGKDSAEAAAAFDDAWWKGVLGRAIERTRARLLSERRIVPFLVYERRADAATLGPQMGLSEEDVLGYLDEVRGRVLTEARAELEADGEGPEALDLLRP